MVFLGFFFKSFNKFTGGRNKRAPFECGFSGKDISRVPFSFRFFLILILFLIFDIEIVLVLQFPFLNLSSFNIYFIRLKIFLLILFFGTVEE